MNIIRYILKFIYKKMTKKNPEVSENMETPETKHELKNLELNILSNSKDRKNFEALSKDPVLKKWLNKILNKGLDYKFESIKETSNEKVDYYIWRMIEKHPELISFIGWELNLPVKIWENNNKTKFSQLSIEQKLKFTALVNVYRNNAINFDKIDTSKIIEKYREYLENLLKEATSRLNTTMKNNKNVFWYVKGKEVLKNAYWLTELEIDKMLEYIELVQNHPEYISWSNWLYEFSPQLASTWKWIVFWILIWLALAAWGYFTYKYISNLFKLDKPETRVYWDHTEITNFEEVFKLMSAQVETSSNRREFEEEGIWHFDESTWWWAIWGVKWVWNKLIDVANSVQSRKLDLEVKTEMGYLFDIKTAKCYVEVKNWKWIFHVRVKKPEVKITNTEAKIHKSSRERINMDKFDDFELRAVETLKKEAIDEAKKPENIQKAKESLRKDMLSVFSNTWFANSQMVILAEDVQDVIIEYEDEQPRYFDPENKKTLVNN